MDLVNLLSVSIVTFTNKYMNEKKLFESASSNEEKKKKNQNKCAYKFVYNNAVSVREMAGGGTAITLMK